jgi:hypothetical protein
MYALLSHVEIYMSFLKNARLLEYISHYIYVRQRRVPGAGRHFVPALECPQAIGVALKCVITERR